VYKISERVIAQRTTCRLL